MQFGITYAFVVFIGTIYFDDTRHQTSPILDFARHVCGQAAIFVGLKFWFYFYLFKIAALCPTLMQATHSGIHTLFLLVSVKGATTRNT